MTTAAEKSLLILPSQNSNPKNNSLHVHFAVRLSNGDNGTIDQDSGDLAFIPSLSCETQWNETHQHIKKPWKMNNMYLEMHSLLLDTIFSMHVFQERSVCGWHCSASDGTCTSYCICKSGRRRQVRSQLEHRPRLETSVPLDSFDEQKSCRNLSIRAQQVKQCMKIITFNDNDYVSPK